MAIRLEAFERGTGSIQNKIDVEYVAILMLILVPQRDFLQRSLPYFEGSQRRDGSKSLGSHQPR